MKTRHVFCCCTDMVVPGHVTHVTGRVCVNTSPTITLFILLLFSYKRAPLCSRDVTNVLQWRKNGGTLTVCGGISSLIYASPIKGGSVVLVPAVGCWGLGASVLI